MSPLCLRLLAASKPMSTPPEMPQVSQPPAAPVSQQPATAPREKNVLGIVAFIVAIVGFIFACIPGALIVGWILLPIAFILAIVSLFMKGKSKALGLAGLIISVVGVIVGVIVFFALVAGAVNDAFGGGETTVETPDTSTSEPSESEEEGSSDEQGTRANPYPIGSAITQGDWTVVVNSVNLDATQAIADANQFNEAAPEGQIYILVNLTTTYNGTTAEGDMVSTMVDYVTADGQTVDSFTSMVVAPEPFDFATTLYEGASTSGNIVFTVPAATASEGTLAVTPSMFGDKVFVAVK